LEELDVSDTNITDASLLAIAQHCHNLVSLAMCGCVRITDAGVKQVMQHCPRLEALGVEACPHVSFRLECEVRRKYLVYAWR
jgi:F-box/leucine-rich repeat protein 2/20